MGIKEPFELNPRLQKVGLCWDKTNRQEQRMGELKQERAGLTLTLRSRATAEDAFLASKGLLGKFCSRNAGFFVRGSNCFAEFFVITFLVPFYFPLWS
jgi:hypothetical protein